MADNLRKYTTQEVLNKVFTDTSGNAIGVNSSTTKETLNAVFSTSDNSLNVALSGGTISGDVTISGDLTVNGNGTGNYDEIVNGTLEVQGSDGTVSGTADVDGDEFVIRNNADAGMSILAGESSGQTSSVIFGSASDLNGANVFYDYNSKTFTVGTQHSSGILKFRSANGTDALTIGSDQSATFTQTVDGDAYIALDNVAGAGSSVNETAALRLNLGDGSTIRGGAKITAKKEADFSSGANMDASLTFSVLENNGYNNALVIAPSGEATFSQNINIGDDKALTLGADSDSQIFNTGSHLFIRNNTSDQDIIFQVNDGGSTQTEVMRIDASSSSVGIGTDSPAEALHVAPDNNNNDGDIKVGSRAFFSHRDSGQTKSYVANNYNSDSATFGIRMKGVADSDEKVTILGSGSVGIGTSSPQDAVHIKTTADADIGLQVQNDDTQAFCKVQSGGSALYGGNNSVTFVSGGSYTTALTINNQGAITSPTQPCFSVMPSSVQSDIAVGSDVTVVFDEPSGSFDIGSNFASNTFTAPVTGKYQLCASLRLDSIDTDANYYYLRIITSNRTYSSILDPGVLSGDPAYWSINLPVLADMDANDTAHVIVRQVAGSSQTDIDTEAFFTGFLAC